MRPGDPPCEKSASEPLFSDKPEPALAALLARHRSAEVDAGYAGYAACDEHPAEEPDEWGDLASWQRAAGAS